MTQGTMKAVVDFGYGTGAPKEVELYNLQPTGIPGTQFAQIVGMPSLRAVQQESGKWVAQRIPDHRPHTKWSHRDIDY